MIWFIVIEVLYTLAVAVIVAGIFFHKYEKLRYEHFDKVVGNLHIEPCDKDEKPVIVLELYKDTGDITKRELVHLAVDTSSYLPQN